VQVVPYYPPHIGGMEVVAETIASASAENRRIRMSTLRSDRRRHTVSDGGVVVVTAGEECAIDPTFAG